VPLPKLRVLSKVLPFAQPFNQESSLLNKEEKFYYAFLWAFE